VELFKIKLKKVEILKSHMDLCGVNMSKISTNFAKKHKKTTNTQIVFLKIKTQNVFIT